MGIIKGGLARLGQTSLYFLAFCCAGIIVSIYSYFIAVLVKHNGPVSKQTKAVEGISGLAVIYTLFALTLTCCLGGVPLFAFIAVAFDILLMGGFIAIAVLTREGAKACNGGATTPISNLSQGTMSTYASKYSTACKLNKTVFAVAIIAAVLFLLTALVHLLLVRTHKKEQRFDPGPSNDHISGEERGFFARRRGRQNDRKFGRDMEDTGTGANGGLAATHFHRTSPSGDTSYTGSTATGPEHVPYKKVDNDDFHGYVHPQPSSVGQVDYTGSVIAAPMGAPNTITHETGFGANHQYHTRPVQTN
ncbi:Hypothetical protein R9X50_00683200 [Acrodontium crateriforme]|uniref:MARVEL domain-containing protein n=1 Tax=Acrodontium crateriforme TaxID=150365 RepID=A0AAQ3M964_9PEZI|nr:Hypothetical protein R9X50_00683200 [Acrodontium crateriforme]